MTITEDRVTLPAVDCAPWCRDGKGHTDMTSPGDQACFSDPTRVELASMPLLTWQGKIESRDYLEVALLRENDARSTKVYLTHNEDAGLELTLDEALDLVRAVTLLVSAAKAAQAGVAALGTTVPPASATRDRTSTAASMTVPSSGGSAPVAGRTATHRA